MKRKELDGRLLDDNVENTIEVVRWALVNEVVIDPESGKPVVRKDIHERGNLASLLDVYACNCGNIQDNLTFMELRKKDPELYEKIMIKLFQANLMYDVKM